MQNLLSLLSSLRDPLSLVTLSIAKSQVSRCSWSGHLALESSGRSCKHSEFQWNTYLHIFNWMSFLLQRLALESCKGSEALTFLIAFLHSFCNSFQVSNLHRLDVLSDKNKASSWLLHILPLFSLKASTCWGAHKQPQQQILFAWHLVMLRAHRLAPKTCKRREDATGSWLGSCF